MNLNVQDQTVRDANKGISGPLR